MERFSDEELSRIEDDNPGGVSSVRILEIFASRGIKFSEATLRKYVQLGLLPRSVRVGRKGKHRGSQGMYPASVVRQIQRIKEMMAEDFTIEEIQRQFLFVRGDIEELERMLGKIFQSMRDATKDQRSDTTRYAIANELGAAEALAGELVDKLGAIEERLTTQAKVAKRASGS